MCLMTVELFPWFSWCWRQLTLLNQLSQSYELQYMSTTDVNLGYVHWEWYVFLTANKERYMRAKESGKHAVLRCNKRTDLNGIQLHIKKVISDNPAKSNFPNNLSNNCKDSFLGNLYCFSSSLCASVSKI